ncbi:hypothetical protein [Colwellia sp. 12G3]|uniref:hypothetical protein n=1 Tax=Colwellia sp. 12G3 TaxID=2058299 RepID=UPI000C329032|nr:hypothetical protein [Colwellia sp. 12G3]PKI15784.1 hypothetical protein CXF71_12290 [Colwellia sp. 12G3]
MRGLLYKYLLVSGVLTHVLFVLLLLWQPIILNKLTSKVSGKYYQFQKQREYEELIQGNNMTLAEEIDAAFLPWQAHVKNTANSGVTFVNKKPFLDLSAAVKSLKHGDTLFVAEGVHYTPLVITKNDITIKGNGHVVFEKSAAHGKGFILSQGNNLTVENIECRYISVRDGNGACIRQEGKDLTLNHVYFHNSQEGVLETAKETGFLKIYDSRFERLGFNGQAHGIYTNKADVYIYQSLIIAAKSEGHAIKVRGNKLVIESSIVATLSSDDSRLIDMSNGGELTVKNSILEQGPKSENGQMIGFGLEGMAYESNRINLVGNIIYLDRIGINKLLALPSAGDERITVTHDKNIVIGDGGIENEIESNSYFQSRVELGLPNYPYFSPSFCQKVNECFLTR